jgi:hypothetical protein
MDLIGGQLAARETLVPAEARMEPTEVQLAAIETLVPAEAPIESAEAQRASIETLVPAEAPIESCRGAAGGHRAPGAHRDVPGAISVYKSTVKGYGA